MFEDTVYTQEHSWVEAGPLAQVPDGDFGSSKGFLLVRFGWIKETDRANFKLLTVQG